MKDGRILRAAAASVVVALCGIAAHLLAGGTVAGWVAPLLIAATLPLAVLITAQPLGNGQMLGLLAIGQVVVHAVSGHASTDGLPMLLAHVLATAASLIVLRNGEAAWWRVADALELTVHRALPRQRVAVPRPRAVEPVGELWFPRLTMMVTAVGGRAPPVGA